MRRSILNLTLAAGADFGRALGRNQPDACGQVALRSVQEDSPAAWRRVDLKTTLTYSMSAPLRRYPIFPGFSALSTARESSPTPRLDER
jgi:hypothetical protein